MKQKVYISGKMRGDPDFRERFTKAAEVLYEIGMWPVNPAEYYNKPPFGYPYLLLIDLWALSQCSAIYMLKGWEDSPGAKAEKAFAEAIGLTVMYEGGETEW